jgi:hypothetical protein
MSKEKDEDSLWQQFITWVVVGTLGLWVYLALGETGDSVFDGYVTIDGKNQKLDGRDSLYGFAPRNQRYFSTFISNTKSQIDENTSGHKKKKIWINASKKLCSDNTFEPFGRKVGWIGYVDKVIMTDRGEIGMDVEIDVHSNLIRQGEIPKRFENVLLELAKGDIVKFSGRFQKGNMSENECIDGGLDSNPELTDEPFDFTLSSLEKLPIIEFAPKE